MIDKYFSIIHLQKLGLKKEDGNLSPISAVTINATNLTEAIPQKRGWNKGTTKSPVRFTIAFKKLYPKKKDGNKEIFVSNTPSDLIYYKNSRILLLGSKKQSNLKIDNRLVLTLA